MTPTQFRIGELKVRAAVARLANIGEALRAACSEAAVLEWLAREAARPPTVTACRRTFLTWLEAVKAGDDPGPFGDFEVGTARRAVKSTRGLAAAAAKLTGAPIASFKNAQREAARPRRRR